MEETNDASIFIPIAAGVDPGGGANGAIAPRKTHKSNFIHHDFFTIRKSAFAV